MARNRNRAARRRTIKGRGDYNIGKPDDAVKAIHDIDKRLNRMESKMPKAPETAVGKAAGTLGRLAGGMLGNSDLGGQAAEALASWFGYGDYTINHNSLVKGDPELGLHFDKDGRRGIRITEREYIGDIVSGTSMTNGATDFDSTVFRVNPGAAETFPWLSKIAPMFDQWKPNGIIFEFKSTSSAYNGASQALGVVGVATDYDVLDPPYASKVEAEQADYSNSCKASEDLLHGLECEAKERPDGLYFVRHGPVDPNLDSARFYDLGNVQVFTKGMSTTGVVLGELWVSYDITFYKKMIPPIPPPPPPVVPYYNQSWMGRSGMSQLAPVGDTLVQNTGQYRMYIDLNNRIFIDGDVTGKAFVLVTQYDNSSLLTLGSADRTVTTMGYYWSPDQIESRNKSDNPGTGIYQFTVPALPSDPCLGTYSIGYVSGDWINFFLFEVGTSPLPVQ